MGIGDLVEGILVKITYRFSWISVDSGESAEAKYLDKFFFVDSTESAVIKFLINFQFCFKYILQYLPEILRNSAEIFNILYFKISAESAYCCNFYRFQRFQRFCRFCRRQEFSFFTSRYSSEPSKLFYFHYSVDSTDLQNLRKIFLQC